MSQMSISFPQGDQIWEWYESSHPTLSKKADKLISPNGVVFLWRSSSVQDLAASSSEVADCMWLIISLRTLLSMQKNLKEDLLIL